MALETQLAKKAVHDKLAAQLKTAGATLTSLQARAERAKANVELKAAADLIVKKAVMQEKLLELKSAGEDRWERVRQDAEVKLADFEKSVKDLSEKIKRG